jgi:hypothetical protein
MTQTLSSICTALYGSQTSGQSLMGGMSTTLMAIEPITDRSTSKSCQARLTPVSTCARSQTGNDHPVLFEWPSVPLPTGAKTTQRQHLRLAERGWQAIKQRGLLWLSASLTGFVMAAARFLAVTHSARQRNTAAQRISSGISGARRMATVHTLEVADAHCYYADGMLVSNCEALHYALYGSD